MLDTGTQHTELAKDRISQERHPILKPTFCLRGMMLQLKEKTPHQVHKKETCS